MSASRHSGPRARVASSAQADVWARRLRRGEPEAVRQVRDRVCRILAYRALGIPQHERDDLEQEITTQLWQAVNRSGFDFTAGFWGFVEVVTARRSIDWLRTRREGLPLQPALRDGRKGPLKQVLEQERLRLASATVAALAPPCRELISLHLSEGKSYRELSKLLGKSEGALRVQMYRCIRSARKILEQLSDGLK